MLPEGLWCALAAHYSARDGHWAGSGLSELAPSWLRAAPALISVSQRFPRLPGYYHHRAGLLSVRYEFSMYPGYLGYLGWAYGRLPLFAYLYRVLGSSLSVLYQFSRYLMYI